MKYALAVLGLMAVVAIVSLWRVKYDVAIRDAGWYGKSVSASAIYFRVRGFLPVVSASWKSPTLATAAE
jgi:hypothetical protein